MSSARPVTQNRAGASVGVLRVSLLWYYRLEQTELPEPAPVMHRRELFASKHIDTSPVDCVNEVCFVVTQNEYAR